MRNYTKLLLAPVLLVGALRAETVSTGNTPGGSNILFNNTCPAATFVGETIQGCISTGSFGTLYYDMSGASGVSFEGTGGQSVVTEENGNPFTQFSINSPTGFSFSQIVLIINGSHGVGSPIITFTSFFVGGTQHTADPVTAPSSGYFTIQAGAGQSITGISFTSDRNLADVRQVRIGGVSKIGTPDPDPDPVVPEPSTVAFALLGCGAIALRKFRGRKA